MDVLIFQNVNQLTIDSIDGRYKDAQCLFYLFDVKNNISKTLFGTPKKLLNDINSVLSIGNFELFVFKRDDQVFPFSYNEKGFFFSLSIFYSVVTPNSLGDIICNNTNYLKDTDSVISNTFGYTIVKTINDFIDNNHIRDDKALLTNPEYIEKLEQLLNETLFVDFFNKLGLNITKITINKRNLESDRPGWGLSDLIM